MGATLDEESKISMVNEICQAIREIGVEKSDSTALDSALEIVTVVPAVPAVVSAAADADCKACSGKGSDPCCAT